MAKVFQMLEKMGLVRMQSEPDPVIDDSPEPDDAEAATEELGIAPGPPPEAVETVSPDVFDRTLEEDGGPEDYPFEKIYSSAGIEQPEHGFTVDRLMDMMRADEVRDLEPATRARVIAGMLRRLPTGPVEVADIVREAARRDQALDAFERFLADRVTATEREVEQANQILQREIDELVEMNTAIMEANRSRVTGERDRLERWRERKQAEEDRLFDAVQPFVEANPVTRSGEPEDDGPESGSD